MAQNQRIISISLLILSVAYSGYIMTNVDFRAGAIYFALSLAGLVIYAIWDFTIKDIKNEKLYDFGGKTSIYTGIVLAIVFIVITAIAPALSMLAPQPISIFSTIGNITYIAGLVAIVEEFQFRGWLLAILDKYLPFPLAMFGSSGTFAIYHSVAYGDVSWGFYVGAFVFGIIACIVTKLTGGIGGAVVMHGMNNAVKYIKDNSLLMIVS